MSTEMRTDMPARIRRGLSRNRRRGGRAGAAGAPRRFGEIDVTVAGINYDPLKLQASSVELRVQVGLQHSKKLEAGSWQLQASFLDVEETLELVPELADVAEVLVDRRKPRVRHFI